MVIPETKKKLPQNILPKPGIFQKSGDGGRSILFVPVQHLTEHTAIDGLEGHIFISLDSLG